MVRKEDVTHIDQTMKAYAEKHGLKGIKIDHQHTRITEYDGVIHFTYETSIPEKPKPREYDYCPNCGEDILIRQEDYLHCPFCGEDYPLTAKCPNCHKCDVEKSMQRILE